MRKGQIFKTKQYAVLLSSILSDVQIRAKPSLLPALFLPFINLLIYAEPQEIQGFQHIFSFNDFKTDNTFCTFKPFLISRDHYSLLQIFNHKLHKPQDQNLTHESGKWENKLTRKAGNYELEILEVSNISLQSIQKTHKIIAPN